MVILSIQIIFVIILFAVFGDSITAKTHHLQTLLMDLIALKNYRRKEQFRSIVQVMIDTIGRIVQMCDDFLPMKDSQMLETE